MLNRSIFFTTSLLLIVFLVLNQSFAQYSGNTWNGIRFNKSDNSPTLDPNMVPPSGTGGGAVAVDPFTGRLLFYTDGTNVYDATHQAMPGSPLSGDPNKTVSVVPDPGNPGRYIIYTSNVTGIQFSVVDMNTQGNSAVGDPPLGSVILSNQNAVTTASEAKAVIATGNPLEYFLLYHNTTSNTLEVRRILASGALEPTVVTSIPVTAGMVASDFSMLEMVDGTYKISVVPSSNHEVALFTYHPATASFTSDGTVPGTSGNIYDTEWAADGEFLYLSSTSGQVYQFDTQNPTDPMIALLATPFSASFGLQRGPDNQIYHIYESNGTLQVGRINNPDSVVTLINYDPAPLGTAPFTSRKFSSYMPGQSAPFNVDFTWSQPVCQNGIVTFFPTWDSESLPDQFSWIFGDSISNAINPNYSYGESGVFPVTLEVIRGMDTSIVVHFINVDPNDLTLDIGADTVICPGETLVLDIGDDIANAAIPPITWSSGGIHNTPSGRSIEVDTTGIYWVTVTLNNGCRLYDAIQVELYGDEYQRTNVWYFGDRAGIDFNLDPSDPDNPTRPLLDSELDAIHGTATISDRNGDLLLYTNGEVLYGVNRATGDHELIDANLGGSPTATQSSIIIPHPGDETLFYIFTIDDSNNLSYTLVDIKGGTAGEIIEKNVALFSPSGERLTAVEMNGGVVLLAHEMGGNSFYAFPITREGIGSPVISSAGSDHSQFVSGNDQGYMEFSPDGTKVAVALSGPDNTIEIFDFDNNTLVVEHPPYTITFPETYDEYQVYGVEFSPAMNKLLVSLVGASGSVLYEVRIDSADQDYMQDRINAFWSGPERVGAIQRAPNGEIYVAVDGASTLGVIYVREDTLASSQFVVDGGHDLGGRTSTLGLPNFIQSFGLGPQEPAISVVGALCVGSVVTFGAATTSMIDEVSWSIVEVNGTATRPIHSSTEEEFELDFAIPGQYRAILRMTNRCGLDTTLTENFQIFDNPAPPTLSAVSVICSGGSVQLDAAQGRMDIATFLWSTGATENPITVIQPGTYSVTITDINGCSSDRSTNVIDSSPTANVGNDQVVCQFDPVLELPSGVPTPLLSDFTITWYVDNVLVIPDGNPNTITVNTDVPGAYTYRVEVLDLLTNCSATDEATITINVRPDLETSAVDATCGDANGNLNVNNPGGFDFEWFDSNNNPVADPSAVTAGVYTVVISDPNPASSCTFTKTQTVNDADASIDPSADVIPSCEGGDIEISLNVFPVDLTYNVYSSDGSGLVTTQTLTNTGPSFLIQNLPRGEYVIEIVDAIGCISTTQALIEGLDQTTFSNRINSVCSPDGEIEVYGFNGTLSSVTWILPNGTVSPNQTAILGNLSQSGEYNVVATVANLCPSDTLTINLNLRDAPPLSITTQDGCNGTASATANAPNAIIYRWAGYPTINSPTISFNQVGAHQASVTVYDDQGCSATASATARAYGEILVQISSSIACEDDNPIELRADGNQTNLQFDWYIGGTIRQTSQTYTVPQEFETGEIRVVGRIAGTDCAAEDRISLIRRPLTPVFGVRDTSYCSLDPLFMPFEINPTNVSDFESYVWKDISGNERYWNSPLQVYQSIEGRFIGEFTNQFGCVTEQPVLVSNDCLPVIFVPNAFTPNGDGKNDRFLVFPKYVTHFEIFIFSRWGELIFYSDQLDFEWDGYVNGKLLPLGTYPYLMRYRSLTDPNRGVIEQRGGVLLLR